jgi:hypothetical protein
MKDYATVRRKTSMYSNNDSINPLNIPVQQTIPSDHFCTEENSIKQSFLDNEPRLGTIEEVEPEVGFNPYILTGYRINYNSAWKVFKTYILVVFKVVIFIDYLRRIIKHATYGHIFSQRFSSLLLPS